MPDLRAEDDRRDRFQRGRARRRAGRRPALPRRQKKYNVLYAELMRIDQNLRAAYLSCHGDARANEPKYVCPAGHGMRPFKASFLAAATCATAGQSAMVNSCVGVPAVPKKPYYVARVLDGDGVAVQRQAVGQRRVVPQEYDKCSTGMRGERLGFSPEGKSNAATGPIRSEPSRSSMLDLVKSRGPLRTSMRAPTRGRLSSCPTFDWNRCARSLPRTGPTASTRVRRRWPTRQGARGTKWTRRCGS